MSGVDSQCDLSASVGGASFSPCIANASGPLCTTIDELRDLGRSAAGAIVTKSCTLLPRDGNAEPRCAPLCHGGFLQSMGLPNLGYKAYAEFIPLLKREFPTKAVVASVAGLCEDDNMTIMRAIDKAGPHLIELNLSCPNIVGKPQVAYDFEETKRLLRVYSEGIETPLGLKLPPYFDPCHHDEMASIIKEHQANIKFLTCINSVGNALVIDHEAEKPVIRPKGGFGGLSGTYVKPVGLANVNAFRTRLPQSIDIFGVGGISTGADAFEYLLAGASAVQIGTLLWTEGLGCFGRVEKELRCVLQGKGYQSAKEAVGKLKEFGG